MEGLFAIGFIVILLVFVVCHALKYGNPSEHIGRIGEALTERALRRLPTGEYVVFNDLVVVDSNGKTTQIDHVVVSRFGIFVIETKCYSGWIFGDATSRVWTQTLPCGRGWWSYSERNTFQNPIRQNWRHIYVLAEQLNLPKRYFFNLVVFTGAAEFKTTVPANVMNDDEVVSYIMSFDQTIISVASKDKFVADIQNLNAATTDQQRKNHVHMLYVEHSPAPTAMDNGARPFCPKCGAEMLVRHRHSDNAPFYGCSRYPKCKGIVNIKS